MKRHATMIAVLLLAVFFAGSIHAQQAPRVPLDVPNSVVLPDPMFKGGGGSILGQWATVASLPNGKMYQTVGEADGMLYVFAGVSDDTESAFDPSSFKYDPATDTWTQIADFPFEKFLLGRAETVNGKIYIFGGVENLGSSYKANQAMVEYDPATDTYTQKTPMPAVQSYAGSGVINDNIYVIAGNGVTESVYLRTVQVYDPATDSWFQNTDYPRDVKFMGATTVGDKIVCMGGFNATYSPSRYIADTYVGELVGGVLQWTKGANAAIGPIIFPVAGGYNGKAYFVAGWPAAFNNAPATQYGFSYDIASDTWLMLEMKPTGVNYMGQAPVIDGKVYFAGGASSGGATTKVVEVLATDKEGGPVAYFPHRSVKPWVKTGTTTTSEPMIIVNWGVDELTWSATVEGDVANYLSLDKESGALQPLAGDTFMVRFSTSLLTEGAYSGELVFTTNDPEQQTMRMPVVLNVQDEDVDTEPFVLVEQYTGTWCPWCPYGTEVLEQVTAAYGNKMHRAAWHYGDPMQITEYSLIGKYLGVSSYPSASINRTHFAGESKVPVGRNTWQTRVGLVLNNWRAPVSISISDKDYDETTKQYSFTAKVFFHRGMESDLRINAIVTEDGIIRTDSPQKKTENGVTNSYPNYVHNDVVMGIYPNALGARIEQSQNYLTQSELTHTFSFTSPHGNSDNAKLIVFVHEVMSDGTPGPVMQSFMEPLMKDIVLDVEEAPAPGDFALRQNYPNPFNPATTISFDVPEYAHVRITLHDALGRLLGTVTDESYVAGTHQVLFDAGDLQSGTYYLTMHAGEVVQTRTMTLVK
ncbi:MAG: Omp28-related outer membrane protein [Bacteroidetes bacterium]|nr:Omp28-related outer membrane protein [Bacteroidota bacterium]